MIKKKYTGQVLAKTGSLGRLYSDEQIRNISALGNVLREIRSRLKHEGVSIEEAREKIAVSRRKNKATL